AGGHVGKVEYAPAGQLGRGLSIVTIESPVGGAHRFAEHQHQQTRLAVLPSGRAARVEPDLDRRLRSPLDLGSANADECGKIVAWGDQLAQVFLIARERGHTLTLAEVG